MDVVATVASVGPYVFQTSALGKRSNNVDAISGASVSPQNQNLRTCGSMPSLKLESIRHNLAKEGVETQTVISDRANALYNFLGSAISSFVTLNKVPPVARL